MENGRVGYSFFLSYWKFSSKITGYPFLSKSKVSKKAGGKQEYVGGGLLWGRPHGRVISQRVAITSMGQWSLGPHSIPPGRKPSIRGLPWVRGGWSGCLREGVGGQTSLFPGSQIDQAINPLDNSPKPQDHPRVPAIFKAGVFNWE